MLLLPLLLPLLLLGLLVLLLRRFLADLVEELFLAVGHQLIQTIVLLVRRVVGWIIVDVVVVGDVVEDAGLVRVDRVLIVIRIDEMVAMVIIIKVFCVLLILILLGGFLALVLLVFLSALLVS